MTTTPVGADLLVERFGARADIVLNRPERRNAVTRSLASQLKAAIVEAANDVEVRAIVLRGAGGCFCSGMDLKAAGDDLADEPRDTWTQVHAAIYECQTPIVVALERFAINAGAALVLAADLTVAGEGAFLQVSEIAMGVAAPMNQAWLHLRHSPAVAGRVTLIGDSEVARAHHVVFGEESRHRMPATESIFGIGISMALPMVRDHGSEAMRQRFLRPGLRGEEIWCQLYSEPNAGSDLASLATRAIRDGDEWIVTGQKVWTSVRNTPTWRFCWPDRPFGAKAPRCHHVRAPDATARGDGPPAAADDWREAYSGERIMRWLGERRAHPSIGKLWRTKQGRFAADIAAALAFPAGVAWTPDDTYADYWQYHVLNCRGMSLGGGTDEMQRNTLGERVLGLPREPVLDTDVPFDSVPRNRAGRN